LFLDAEHYEKCLMNFVVLQAYDTQAIKELPPSLILHADGYVDVSGMQPVFIYHLKDHLGNVRIVLQAGGSSGTLKQSNDYYPFGMAFTRNSSFSEDEIFAHENKYKYNGKEEQPMPGKWLDYGARFYDAQLGRFHTQDRFAEKYLDFSPYHYGANNPILFVDVNGDSLYAANNEDTHNDIKSLAKGKNQQYISFNEDGSVTLDFSGADAKTQKKAMRDKGLQLIGNLVESQDADGNTENYYYEASNTREGVMPDGSEFSISLDSKAGTETGLNDNSFATNLSTTDHGVPGIPEVKPANGYDGTVHISPGTMYTNGGAVPRSSLVRHELSESYNRTHKKMNYNQAHQSAGGVGTYTRFKYTPIKK